MWLIRRLQLFSSIQLEGDFGPYEKRGVQIFIVLIATSLVGLDSKKVHSDAIYEGGGIVTLSDTKLKCNWGETKSLKSAVYLDFEISNAYYT